MRLLSKLIGHALAIAALGLVVLAQTLPEPIIESAALPTYPPLARAARISGDVRLEFTLNDKGEVGSVRTVEGHPMLKGAAEANVASWRFRLPQGLFRTDWKYETTFSYRFSEIPGDYDAEKLTVHLESFHLVQITTDLPSGKQARECPSAEEKRPPKEIADTDYVELSRSGCYGTCPAYTVRVAGSGQVTWNGAMFVAEKGEQTSRIESSQAHSLLARFLAPEVWNLCRGYSRGITDSATTTTHLNIGGHEKTISNYADSAPAWFNDFENAVDSVSDSHYWRHGSSIDEPLWNIFQDAYLPKPGVTRLMIAAANSDVAKMEAAIKDGDKVSDVDASGWTALMYAAASSHSGPVKYLLDKGANPNQASRRGDTPLMASAIARQFDQDLRGAGANVNAQNRDGQTTLMLLAATGEADEVKSALSAGADPLLKDAKGRTALDYLRLANCGRNPLREYQMSEGGKCDYLDTDDVALVAKLLKAAANKRK